MSSIVLAICILGGITFFYRFSFISESGKKIAAKIPQGFLQLLAPATFTAIIANNILAHPGSPLELQQKVGVASLSLAVAYFSRNIIMTLLFGLGLLYFVQNY